MENDHGEEKNRSQDTKDRAGDPQCIYRTADKKAAGEDHSKGTVRVGAHQ